MHLLSGRSGRHRTLGLVLAAVLAVGVVVLLIAVHRGPPHRRQVPAKSRVAIGSVEPAHSSGPSAAPSRSSVRPARGPLVRTNDPVRYARAVATALFEVNPALVRRTDFMAFWNGELPTVVYADAADQGLTLRVQTSDALANLAEWIPGIGAWAQEARDHVVSALRIESVSVPDYWTTAVADGIFTDPGLHMERLTGLVDQSYNGGDRRYTNTRPIVIDLALLCPPTQPGGCRLVAPQPPGVQLGS